MSRTAFLIYGLVLGALAFAMLGEGQLPVRGSTGPGVLRVGVGDGGVATIGEALGKARSGQRIEVSPGEYRETLQLRDGVSLVSLVPRAAVILPPPGSAEPAVTAQGIGSARFEGFRIVGDAQTPLQVGLRLADSAVEVEGVEIAGAAAAGITVSGIDRSTIRYSYLHDNPGGGVLAESGAGTRLLHNLIARNGRPPASPAQPGVEVREGAQPELIDNRFEGNGGGGVLLPAADRAAEILAWNTFAGARADGVRVTAPPAAPQGRTPSRGRSR